MRIRTPEELDALYGPPSQKALDKEIDYLSDHYRRFVEKSPFAIIATIGANGLDCSPRGDPAGFIRIIDEKTLQLPDRRGNNRLDTLRNLVVDPRISLLFLIPGISETLRVKGRTEILTDNDLCTSYAVNGKSPKCVVQIRIDRVYFQCKKALARAHLWDTDAQVDRKELPSAGEIIEALSNENFDGKAYDESYTDYMKKTIY